MEKKCFVALLMVVVMMCACWTGAVAEDERDYQYVLLDDGTIEITNYKGNADRLTIPAKIAGKTVTSIGYYAFAGCGSLTLTVPRNSYAAEYAKANNIPYTYPDANDWLNN